MRSLELESHGIFLPPNAGRRLRQILGNGLILFDSCVDAVLEEMSLTTRPSTAARAFSMEYDEKIRRDDAVNYLEWLSKHSHIEYESLFKWVLEDQVSDPRICPLAASSISSHTPAGLAEFGRRIEALLRSADCCTAIADKPTASLLPQGARQDFCRMETAKISAAYTAFRTESEFARKRFGGFTRRHEDRRSISTCILSWVGVDAAMQALRFDHQRDALVENLLHRVETGYVKLGYVDDRPGHRAAAVRASFEEFDVRAVIDGTLSVRRHRMDLRRYLFEAGDSAAQRAMVMEDIDVVEQARRLAVFDFEMLSRWLLEYASGDCWRKLKKQHDENW